MADRVKRFRRAVYLKRPPVKVNRSGAEVDVAMTNGCRLLLLRLSDDMNTKCVVSIPRSKLASEFGVDPSRISEWVAIAKDHGFLSTVRRGRPGVTAVYQGTIPLPPGASGTASNMVRKTAPDMVRPSAPTEGDRQAGTWCALGGSQVVETAPDIGTRPRGSTRDVSQLGEADGHTDRAHLYGFHEEPTTDREATA